MKYLFVGGCKDGQRLDGDGRSRVIVRKIKSPLAVMSFVGDWPKEKTIEYEQEIYERQYLRGIEEDFVIYAPLGMTGDAFIKLLLDGYRNPNANEMEVHSNGDRSSR